jgi:hypothetical protein
MVKQQSLAGFDFKLTPMSIAVSLQLGHGSAVSLQLGHGSAVSLRLGQGTAVPLQLGHGSAVSLQLGHCSAVSLQLGHGAVPKECQLKTETPEKSRFYAKSRSP